MPETATQGLTDATLRYADLDEVVLVAATERRGGPTLLVQRCAGLPARCTAIVEIGYATPSGLPAAAREAWAAVRAADLRYPPSVFGDARVTGTRVAIAARCAAARGCGAASASAAVVATVAIIAVVTSSRPPPVVGVNPGSF